LVLFREQALVYNIQAGSLKLIFDHALIMAKIEAEAAEMGEESHNIVTITGLGTSDKKSFFTNKFLANKGRFEMGWFKDDDHLILNKYVFKFQKTDAVPESTIDQEWSISDQKLTLHSQNEKTRYIPHRCAYDQYASDAKNVCKLYILPGNVVNFAGMGYFCGNAPPVEEEHDINHFKADILRIDCIEHLGFQIFVIIRPKSLTFCLPQQNAFVEVHVKDFLGPEEAGTEIKDAVYYHAGKSLVIAFKSKGLQLYEVDSEKLFRPQTNVGPGEAVRQHNASIKKESFTRKAWFKPSAVTEAVRVICQSEHTYIVTMVGDGLYYSEHKFSFHHSHAIDYR